MADAQQAPGALGDVRPMPLGTYQFEIYCRGLGGETPVVPLEYDELEARARAELPPEAWAYAAGGAGEGRTIAANRAAFDRWSLVPRMLTDVAVRDWGTDVLGTRLNAPVLLGPVGVLSIVHPDAELAVARAAAATGAGMVLSTAASTSLEDVAAAAGDAPRWFQLYWPNDPDLAASFLQRAEKAGYTAVVVTLDTWLLAWRPRDLEGAYLPFLKGIGTANYFSDPVFRSGLEKPPEEDLQAAVGHWIGKYSDPTVTWERLAMLREATELPIILKGIQHPDDARRAVEEGVEGILVSNHGGRQVDGSVAALDALVEVRGAVGPEATVLMDSGVRSGSDIVKAIALGADAVLLGRPYAYGLAVGGQAGVEAVIRQLAAELDITLALVGARAARDLDASMVTSGGSD
jgi:lactate 2-monooxygenase